MSHPSYVSGACVGRHRLDPRRRKSSIISRPLEAGCFLLPLDDLLHDDIEAAMAFDGVLTPSESASFAGQAGLSHSLAWQNTPKRLLHRFPSQGPQVPPPVGKPEMVGSLSGPVVAIRSGRIVPISNWSASNCSVKPWSRAVLRGHPRPLPIKTR